MAIPFSARWLQPASAINHVTKVLCVEVETASGSGVEPPAPKRRSVSQVHIARAAAGHGCTPWRAQLGMYKRCAERYPFRVPLTRPFQTSFVWPEFTKTGR